MSKTKSMKRGIALLLIFLTVIAALFCLPSNMLLADAAKQVTDADIKAAQQKIKDNEEKIKKYEEQIKGLDSDLENAADEKALLDQMINQLETTIDETDGLIQKYEELIATKEDEIAERQNEISQKYSGFLQRLRISYEEGTQNYLELLVSSENLMEFMTRSEYLGSILTREKEQMEELEQEVSDLNALKTGLTQKKEEYLELGDYQAQSRQQLNDKLKQAEDLIKRLQADQAAAQKAHDKAVSQDATLEKELQDLIKKQQEQQQAAAKGSLLWPLDSSHRTISSKYGNRILYGKNDFHLGVDIPAPYGTDIYASNDGTVLKAEYNSSYGYFVLIDHGGTLSTRYAHCSKLLVKKGDTVKRGQVIAKVGATGNAYGYHLHFEVRKNGVTTNPLVTGMLVINNNGKMVDPVAQKLLKYS